MGLEIENHRNHLSPYAKHLALTIWHNFIISAIWAFFFMLLFNQVTDTNGSKRRVTAETLVIATGDSPQYPGIPGDREYCVTRSPSTQTRHSVPTSKEMSKSK